jgi:two-component system sensor histidine kinase HydH
VTIRKTLLRAFLLIGLTPALLLAVLAFVTAQEAMQAEIENSLAAQADVVASDINKTLFERLQNAATWSTLEVMQDLQVQDVDKRISNFLAKLKAGYGGVYRDLYVIDRDGRVVSSSDAAAIARVAGRAPAWQSSRLAGVDLTLDAPREKNGIMYVSIHAPIISQFRGDILGELVLDFDWDKINALLDSAASNERMIALVDVDGKVYAASLALRKSGALSGLALAGWQLQTRERGAFVHTGTPISHSNVVVGLGRASGFAGYQGMGLRTLVIESASAALAPVHRMAAFSLAILATLVLVTLVVAGKVSGTIARPIVALTVFTRNYKLGQKSASASATASGEVGELGKAFEKMISDIDNARRDLVRASKLAVVGEMSSVIIHEVRTPLGIIRSSAQMLKREVGISAEGRELTEFIESETERLNRLVSSMLDSTRPRALRKVPTDLHSLIHRSSVLLGAQIAKGRIIVSEKFEAKDATVECDTEQITQVLLNLILNAVQILQPGGTIRLATYDAVEWICIEISDDGPGIPLDEHARVFEAFFCRREGGVGLGLAIVQQIVFAHGGEIEVGKSDLGGARFNIRLFRQSNPMVGGLE